MFSTLMTRSAAEFERELLVPGGGDQLGAAAHRALDLERLAAGASGRPRSFSGEPPSSKLLW
jgi:hypothetical protein